MNRQQYEDDLYKRQQEHLQSVGSFGFDGWSPCMHDSCGSCLGTGIKNDGSMCIHGISCPCPKCTPR